MAWTLTAMAAAQGLVGLTLYFGLGSTGESINSRVSGKRIWNAYQYTLHY